MLSPIIAVFFLQASQALEPIPAASSVPSPSLSCDAAGYDGFDFWLGEWDVYSNGRDTKVANSRIERKHSGCAVLESWMPLRGQGGSSLNHYDAETGQWYQKWVGSSPGAVEFVGGVTKGIMVLTGNWPQPDAPHTLIRMTYTKNEDGSVRQHGEASTDHGLSWQTSFDFTYRPKEDAPE